MPKLIRKTLAEISARPVSAAEQDRLCDLAKRPDSALDLTDPTEISDADLQHGRARVVPHGGAREGAGRKPSGRRPITLRLKPGVLRTLRAQAKREGKTVSEIAENRLLSA
ncbi:MAG TPA: hypothetical protein VHD62_00080 [Opitutaceae bacterium]|nr:hypothetical protein [Opitutaceae bacterium]